MSLWHSLKVRLGLEDDFEDFEDYDDEEDEREAIGYRGPYGQEAGGVKRVERAPDLDRARGHLRGVPDPRSEAARESERAREGGWSAPEPAQVKMHIVEPRAFGEAQGIGDKLKKGTPVIMNLTGTGPDLSKRLLDFASGLTYGLDGGLQKVSDKVFMLTPANVEVSAEDRRRLKDKGLFSLD